MQIKDNSCHVFCGDEQRKQGVKKVRKHYSIAYGFKGYDRNNDKNSLHRHVSSGLR